MAEPSRGDERGTQRVLYTFFRSSTSYRLRIALAFKGLDWEARPVDLAALAHHNPAYRAVNPQQMVPVLIEACNRLTQTQAILEYLEETHPEPPMLPYDPFERAYVRALANIVACDMHPLCNARVLRSLASDFGMNADAVQRWYAHWIATGFAAFEAMLAEEGRTGAFCLGERPTMADIYLVPQIANAQRFACDLAPYPRLMAIGARAAELEPFARAAPALQADAV